jgi:hypothetical protein
MPNRYPFTQNQRLPSFFHCLLCRLTRKYLSRRTRAFFPVFSPFHSNIPYVHSSRPEIEKFSNQTEWEPNTLVETEQEELSVTVSQTTTPQAPKEKRPRQDVSPSIIEVSSEEFQLHTKRPKTSQALDMASEKGMQSTTTLEVDRSLLHKRNKQIMTTVLPKNSTYTPPASQPSKIGPKLSIF